ncbi:GNAT family N-acetyltransferase [Streptomyces yaizuensis]|uniref:GNAT family N-acetyltransferase n=1 Tax=Streptomyces yaizuensis TaxID=2989713 RepID=A0ABQ5P383_9ACTN|nr:GNAT family N-acetyltransferase [Streptomyces sp. YSPA8]GLF97061.1 GNAT family N-acetyltransferase [Streptomyces sp. YSPA8]
MNNPLAQEATGLTVAPASLEDWRLVAEWCATEGWNPGDGDLDCFHPTDPGGFFIGRVDGRPVTSVSVVNYTDRYAFLGYYVVVPEERGRGLGIATWRTAVPHAADRIVGLDAVPAQQANYARSGFVPAYGTVRWGGRPGRTGRPGAGTERVTAATLDAVTAYDRSCFPAERPGFLGRWLTAPGHTAYVRIRDGRVTGYGVIRPSRDGHRIGPFFADTRDDAEALFDSLTAALGPDDTVAVDMPEPLSEAAVLAAGRGLEPQFPTVRMYTGPAPEVRTERIWGVTTLELG